MEWYLRRLKIYMLHTHILCDLYVGETNSIANWAMFYTVQIFNMLQTHIFAIYMLTPLKNFICSKRIFFAIYMLGRRTVSQIERCFTTVKNLIWYRRIFLAIYMLGRRSDNANWALFSSFKNFIPSTQIFLALYMLGRRSNIANWALFTPLKNFICSTGIFFASFTVQKFYTLHTHISCALYVRETKQHRKFDTVQKFNMV